MTTSSLLDAKSYHPWGLPTSAKARHAPIWPAAWGVKKRPCRASSVASPVVAPRPFDVPFRQGKSEGGSSSNGGLKRPRIYEKVLGSQGCRASCLFLSQTTADSAGIDSKQLSGAESVASRVLQHRANDRVANLTHRCSQGERQRERGLHLDWRVPSGGTNWLWVGTNLTCLGRAPRPGEGFHD